MDNENFILNSKVALPNKLLQDDGSITDITGAPVSEMVDAYASKPALPNKFLNPDGSYSTLNEIIASMVDTSIYVIVDELPQDGDPQKIYLVPDNKGGFIEYRWTGSKWDPIGMLEFDITNYDTRAQVEAKIAVALAEAKAYTDNAIAGLETEPDFYYTTLFKLENGITSGAVFDFWSGLYDPTNTKPFIVNLRHSWSDNTNQLNPYNYTWYFRDHNFEDGVRYVAQCDINGRVEQQESRTAISMSQAIITFHINNGEVQSIDCNYSLVDNYYLDADTNYQTPYTPLFNGSPATKKYVDDAITNNITNVLGGEY